MAHNTRHTLLAVTFALLCSVPALAQTSREEAAQILARLGEERVTLDYVCTIESSGLPFVFEGTLTAQQDCYRAEGNGLVIICNGPVRWTVDEQAREVYIENAGGVREVLLYQDNLVEMNLSNVRYAPLSADTALFTFDTSALSDDWLVTDLREP